MKFTTAFLWARACLKASGVTLLTRLNWNCTQRQCQVSPGWLISVTICHHWLFSIFTWLNMLIVCFFSMGEVENDRQAGGRGAKQRRTGRGRQTERVYWLVSSSSVDCDKFNRGNPHKGGCISWPAPPHHLSLSVSFLCPSDVLSAADQCGQISYVCDVLMDAWGVSFGGRF